LAEFVEDASVAALGDVDNAFKHVSENYSVRVNVEHATTTALAKDATTFALTGSTPDAVVNVILEGVLKTLAGHGALGTYALGNDDADSVTWKTRPRWVVTTLAICHPLCAHGSLPKPLLTSQ
jgi:hypothetical protein